MKFNSKKIAASVVALAMMVPVTACTDKANEEVLEAADSYCTNIVKMKASKIADAVSDVKSDKADLLDEAFGEINSNAILSAIASTLAYEIDEESVEASTKQGEGSVDVVFTYVDADAVYEDVIADNGTEEDFIAALGDSDEVVEVELTLEFVLEDEEWLVDDSKLSQMEEIFGFVNNAGDYIFVPPLSAAMVSDSSRWYYTDSDNFYEATSSIEYDIIPVDDAQDIEWNFYYEIYYNGSLVYTSDECVDQGYWIEAYYEAYYDGAPTDDNGYLAPGDYRCVMYTLNGDVLADATCEVAEVVVYEEPTVSQYDFDNGTRAYWYVYENDGSSHAMTDASGNTIYDEASYSTSDTIMEHTIKVFSEYDYIFESYPLYYEVYFSETGSEDDAELIFTNTVTPASYPAGLFYECQYTTADAGSDFEAGTYFFVVSPAENPDVVFDIGIAVVS